MKLEFEGFFRLSNRLHEVTHNKRMQTDQTTRYALILTADAKRYVLFKLIIMERKRNSV